MQLVADNLLVALGQPVEYGVSNPSNFMNLISLQGTTRFVEKRVSEYALSIVGHKNPTTHEFDLDTSF